MQLAELAAQRFDLGPQRSDLLLVFPLEFGDRVTDGRHRFLADDLADDHPDLGVACGGRGGRYTR